MIQMSDIKFVASESGIQSMLADRSSPVTRGLLRVGYAAEAEAVHLSNNVMVGVRTGRLKGSHYVSPAIVNGSLVVIVGNGVHYAAPVHQGHTARNGRWVEGRPWLLTACQNAARNARGR